MNSEFGVPLAQVDNNARARANARRRFRPDDSSVARGAAVGDEQIAERQRTDIIQRVLVALEAAYYDDYDGRLNSLSRDGFRRFMRYNPDVALPLLGSESTGQLVATWLVDGECLSLRFLDGYRVDYALTTMAPDGPSRVWGGAYLLAFLDEHAAAKRLIAI